MSPLSILVNCIILSVAFRGTFSMPGDIAVSTNTVLQNKIGETSDNSSLRNLMIHDMVCMCDTGLRELPHREDYKYTPGIGSHKLHTRAETWNKARKICNDEGGHLAIINSLAEQRVLMDLFNRSGPFKGADKPYEAFLGIHDLYEEGDWVTVFGEPLAKTGFTVWSNAWRGQPDNWAGRQHCGAVMKDGTMDDVVCGLSYAFFCEIPEITPL